MEILTALGLAIPAGLNAYIPLLAIALAQRFNWLELKQPFDIIGEWWMIAIIAVLLVVEIVADKVPIVDHINDIIQTFIRPAAGGIVAVASAGSASNVSPWLLVLTGVLLAGSVHAVKATMRPVVNVTTAGVGAPVVSAAEGCRRGSHLGSSNICANSCHYSCRCFDLCFVAFMATYQIPHVRKYPGSTLK